MLHRPSGICNLIPLLNDNQLSAIRNIGFDGLLKLQNFFSVPWCHVMWFLKNFNPSSRVLTFNSKKSFVITPEDISDLFLLPQCSGSPVCVVKDNDDVKAFINSLKEKYSESQVVSVSGVYKLLSNQLRDGGNDFKIFFVLYSLSTFFTPKMN